MKEHKQQFNGLVLVGLFFRVDLMRWMRCTDKAVGCNSHTKMKIIKTENNSGIVNPF